MPADITKYVVTIRTKSVILVSAGYELGTDGTDRPALAVQLSYWKLPPRRPPLSTPPAFLPSCLRPHVIYSLIFFPFPSLFLTSPLPSTVPFP